MLPWSLGKKPHDNEEIIITPVFNKFEFTREKFPIAKVDFYITTFSDFLAPISLESCYVF